MRTSPELPEATAQAPERNRLRGAPEWLALGLYGVVVAAAIRWHEPWADEAQAWQIARSLSLRQMFQVLRYEGSPGAMASASLVPEPAACALCRHAMVRRCSCTGWSSRSAPMLTISAMDQAAPSVYFFSGISICSGRAQLCACAHSSFYAGRAVAEEV